MNIAEQIKLRINQNKKFLLLGFFALLPLVPVIYAGLGANRPQDQKVPAKEILGAKRETSESLPTPTQTPTPTPTPTRIPIRITQAPTPTPTPTPTQSNNSSQTSSPTSTPTPANTPIPTPTPTSSPTPTPTPLGLNVEIGVDYAGQKANDSYNVTVDAGQNAWEAIKKAVGIENLQYTDYGGELGIFITGFNGVAAAGNQFFEFRVNGVSSNVGVSPYICNNGDKLEFVLTTF